jgi:hypothetical protein
MKPSKGTQEITGKNSKGIRKHPEPQGKHFGISPETEGG